MSKHVCYIVLYNAHCYAFLRDNKIIFFFAHLFSLKLIPHTPIKTDFVEVPLLELMSTLHNSRVNKTDNHFRSLYSFDVIMMNAVKTAWSIHALICRTAFNHCTRDDANSELFRRTKTTKECY